MATDVESQRPLIQTDKQKISWKEVETCLSSDDASALQSILQSKSLQAVWRPFDAPEYSTALHKSVELGATNCTKLLLESKSTDVALCDSPDASGNTAIFIAAKSGQVECLKLLIGSNVNVNARNNQGHSPLHALTYVISRTKDDDLRQKLLKCCDVLLDLPNIDLEARNNSGFTPLVAAAKKVPADQGARRKGALVPFCRQLVCRGASLEAEDGGRVTARELLEERNALVEVLMGERKAPPQRSFYSILLDSLILGVDGSQIRDLLISQPQEEGHRIANGYIGSETILFYLVDKCNETAVEALLAAGADPWKEQLTGVLCLHRCLSRGHLGILNLLIDAMKKRRNLKCLDFKEDGYTLLSKILENNTKDKEQELNNLKCIERLLEPDIIIDINQRTSGKLSQTILHLAASFNNQDVMRLLLQRGSYIGSHKYFIGENQGNILPVLNPSTLRQAMDSCITYHQDNNDEEVENIQSPDYTLSCNYKFLVRPIPETSKNDIPECNEIDSLMEISRSKEHRKAITHPLIQTFLYAKWRKVLPFYLLNLFLYLLFVVLLTAFMYTLKDLRILEERSQAPNSTVSQDQISGQLSVVNTLMAFLLIVTIYMFIREVIQLFFSVKTYYRNFENYLEWFLIVMVIILCSANLNVELTRHLAAWSMIIAWYEFVLLLGRAPPLSIYVTMLRHVSWNFLKLIFLYGALILAFTVSFNIILQPAVVSENGENNFSNFWSTLPKAIVMATGEFEYSDLSSDFSHKVLYATSAVLVFLVFLFLIFLVLMNVMNGLAVSDTQQVVEEATLYSLRSRLELIFLIEELLLRAPFMKKLLPRIHLVTSGKKTRILARINSRPKSKRISYGRTDDEFCKMDDDTAQILRTQRLKMLEVEKARQRVDPMDKCMQMLQELKDIALSRSANSDDTNRSTLSPASSSGRIH